MDPVVQTAIITGLCTAIPTIIVSVINSNGNRKLMEYRIGKLEEKVDKHNQLVERVALLERDDKDVQDEIKSIKAAIKNAV